MTDGNRLPPPPTDPSEDPLQIVLELREKVQEIRQDIQNFRERLLELTRLRE